MGFNFFEDDDDDDEDEDEDGDTMQDFLAAQMLGQ